MAPISPARTTIPVIMMEASLSCDMPCVCCTREDAGISLAAGAAHAGRRPAPSSPAERTARWPPGDELDRAGDLAGW